MTICIVELYSKLSYFYFLDVMTNAIFLIGQKIMYQQKDLTCITRNIHAKYQSSSTHCLNVIRKVKVLVRMTERRNDRMTDSFKYRFLFYTKILSFPPKGFPFMSKISGRGGKEMPACVREKR